MQAIKELRLEKEIYQEARSKNLTLEEFLEHLDPSPEYQGSLAKMSALERQLLRHDIKVAGPNADVLEKFFASSSSAVLFPAYYQAQVQAGLLATSIVPELVATVTDIDSHTYSSLWMAESEADRQLQEIGEGAQIPTTTIQTGTRTVTLKKCGRLVNATYEALRLQRLNVVSVFLQRVGAQLGIDESDAALSVLINGDGNNPPYGGPLDPTESETSGTLDYDELIRLYLTFPAGYKCQKIVAGDGTIRTILNMSEFKDPWAGFNFQRTGELVSPVGARLLRWTSAASLPSDYVLGVDQRYALEQVTERGLTVETDRLIDRQIERSAVTKWNAFVKLDVNASQAIDINHT